MSSGADHLLNLREEGLIIRTEKEKNKCLYNMTTSNGGKISAKSTNLIESISGEEILLNISQDSQDNLEQKERNLDNPYISLNQDQIIISIGSSKIILEKNKISIKADNIDIVGTSKLNVNSKNISIESTTSTNIKSSGTLSAQANSTVNIAAKGVASLKGSLTKVG